MMNTENEQMAVQPQPLQAEPPQPQAAEPEHIVLRSEGLVKRYGRRTVVNDVSFDVRQGEIVGLLGPNGAGKTTSFYMTTTLKVNNSGEVMGLIAAMNHARRNYADQQTIEGYVSALNKLIISSMTCKGVNQQIPMSLVTTKFGVDYWAMPALKFADENDYRPLTELLDKESVEYGINIIDHAINPMKESIVVMRQLTQALQKLQSIFYMPAEDQPQQ